MENVFFEDNSDKIINNIGQIAKRKVHACAVLLKETIEDGMLNGPKTGRFYSHPLGGQYQASALGEYPQVRTGILLSGIEIYDYEDPQGVYHSHIYDVAPYARYLDNPETGGGIRPFISKAYFEKQQEMQNILFADWNFDASNFLSDLGYNL